jgi:hypothetical protein
MSFELNAVFSLSIVVSVVIGWARFTKTDPAFFPFLLYLSLGFINELTGIIVVYRGYTNIISYNVFGLIESILLTWQFLRWGLFGHNKWLYYFLQAGFVVLWSAESFLLSVQTFNSYFIIAHSFLIVMMSITTINMVVLKESTSLLKQPVFLLCLALILFFTYAILVESFWIVGLSNQKTFRLKIYEILSYINLLSNLLFAFAFLWVPMRLQYILRF